MTPLIQLAIAWMSGIFLARWLTLPWPVLLWLALPGAGALILYRHRPQPRQAALLWLALLAGALRCQLAQPSFTASDLAYYNDLPHPVALTGLVADAPDTRDSVLYLHLRAETLTLQGTTRPVHGEALVRLPRYPEYRYGDRLRLVGRLETPPVFEDFSYRDYLARRGVYTLIRRPTVTRLESGQGHPFWTGLLAFKAAASQVINRILDEPYASLLNGILLGIRSGIPPALYEEFNLTGTSHIIVISGSNISLIAAIFLLLGQKLAGKRYAPLLTLAGIGLYTLLVGADAAVLRAAVMGGLWVLSIWVGRPGLALNTLFASGLLLSLHNPLILWDVGFQLSFLATLGLIVLVPPLERLIFGWLTRLLRRDRAGTVMALLSELLVVTLAAQIITAPLIVYQFGRLSLVSLLTNLLILPVQPPIMTVGGLAVLAGLVWLPAGQALGWLVRLPLAWSVAMVEWTARWPFASLDLGRVPLWLLLALYILLAGWVWWMNRRPADPPPAGRFKMPALAAAETRLWVGGAGAVALAVWLAVASLPDGRLHVAVLDVGQGDAILVTLPDGRQMLVDGGPSPTALVWRLGQQMPFWDRTLELVVNTHPDADHLAGLVELPARYRLEQVLVSDVAVSEALYRQWEQALASAGAAPITARQGMQVNLGNGVSLSVLNPGPASAGADEVNNHSVVLRLAYGQVSFLLPGDVEAPVEQAMLEAGLPLRATVLKSPHHGSKTSSSPAWLEAVDPQVVAVSVGADNRFGHPSPEVLARYEAIGAAVLRTDERGTIEFITDGRSLWVETAR